MNKATIHTMTGTDKNGKPWYAVELTVGDFTSERQFIDLIHYKYLRELEKTQVSIKAQ